VLGISPRRGALVVFTDKTLEGSDLEIRRTGGPWAGIRAEVERRDLKEAECFVAVFAGLAADDYQVRIGGKELGPRLDFPITGGEVTELSWPGA
jgi:hypothetical protein